MIIATNDMAQRLMKAVRASSPLASVEEEVSEFVRNELISLGFGDDPQARHMRAWPWSVFVGGGSSCKTGLQAVFDYLLAPTNPAESRDSINSPSHYTPHPSGVECIAVTEHMSFLRGNAVKYLWRAGQKGEGRARELEDLRKAVWYVQREIANLERAESGQ